MKVRRGRILKFINVLAELLLLFRRPLQLEQHVIHRKVVSDQPAIVLLVRLRPGVSREGDQLAFVHILRNQNRTAILACAVRPTKREKEARIAKSRKPMTYVAWSLLGAA